MRHVFLLSKMNLPSSLSLSQLQVFLILMNEIQEREVDNYSLFNLEILHDMTHQPFLLQNLVKLTLRIFLKILFLFISNILSSFTWAHLSLEHHSPLPQSPTLTSHGLGAIVTKYNLYSIQSSYFSGLLTITSGDILLLNKIMHLWSSDKSQKS